MTQFLAKLGHVPILPDLALEKILKAAYPIFERWHELAVRSSGKQMVK
jgi:hypothetical protein